jgi:hypothetical protein
MLKTNVALPALTCRVALIMGAMLMMDAAAMTAAERVVLNHLHGSGVNTEGLTVSTLSARDLPAGTAEFYVETQGSRQHGAINCVVVDGKVYTSSSNADFARLLKDQRALYALLAMPRQVKYVDATVLARNPDYQAFPEATVPTLAWPGAGGAVLTFYATPLDRVAPAKWTVSVSPAYDVAVARP